MLCTSFEQQQDVVLRAREEVIQAKDKLREKKEKLKLREKKIELANKDLKEKEREVGEKELIIIMQDKKIQSHKQTLDEEVSDPRPAPGEMPSALPATSRRI